MGNLRTIDKFFKLNPQNKRYEPVQWRRQVLPAWLTFDEINITGSLTVPFATPPAPVGFRQPFFSVQSQSGNEGAMFEVRALVLSNMGSTDISGLDSLVVLEELGAVRKLMNNPIHLWTMFGDAKQPAILREPFFLGPQQCIQAQFTRAAAGTDVLRAYLVGAQVYPYGGDWMQYGAPGQVSVTDLFKQWAERKKYVHPFWMTTDTPVSLTASGTAVHDIKVSEDGHFEVFAMNSYASGAYTVEIQEVKTNQTLSNGALHSSFLGSGRYPNLLPTPYLIPAGSRLRMKFTDLSGATNRVHITFAGRKIFAPLKNVSEVLKSTEVKK